MPLYSDFERKATRVLVWQIAEDEQQLRNILSIKQLHLPKNSQRRLERLAIGCLLKHAGLSFPYTYNFLGQPVVRQEVNISISHSQQFAALAINPKTPLGIDIERVNRNFQRVAHKYLTHSELAQVKNETDLALCWSVKEALYKLPWMDTPLLAQEVDIQLNSDSLQNGQIYAEVKHKSQHIRQMLHFLFFCGYVLVWTAGEHQQLLADCPQR